MRTWMLSTVYSYVYAFTPELVEIPNDALRSHAIRLPFNLILGSDAHDSSSRIHPVARADYHESRFHDRYIVEALLTADTGYTPRHSDHEVRNFPGRQLHHPGIQKRETGQGAIPECKGNCGMGTGVAVGEGIWFWEAKW